MRIDLDDANPDDRSEGVWRIKCPFCQQYTLTTRLIARGKWMIPGVECENRECSIFDLEVDVIEFVRRVRCCSFHDAGRVLGIPESLLDARCKRKDTIVDYEEFDLKARANCQYRLLGMMMMGPDDRKNPVLEIRPACRNRKRCPACRADWVSQQKKRFDLGVKTHKLETLYRHECSIAESDAARKKLNRTAAKSGVEPLWVCIKNKRAAQQFAVFFSNVPIDAADAAAEGLPIEDARRLFRQAVQDSRGYGTKPESFSQKWLPQDAEDEESADYELLGRNRSQIKHVERTAARWGIEIDAERHMKGGALGIALKLSGSPEEKRMRAMRFIEECEHRRMFGDEAADKWGRERDQAAKTLFGCIYCCPRFA